MGLVVALHHVLDKAAVGGRRRLAWTSRDHRHLALVTADEAGDYLIAHAWREPGRGDELIGILQVRVGIALRQVVREPRNPARDLCSLVEQRVEPRALVTVTHRHSDDERKRGPNDHRFVGTGGATDARRLARARALGLETVDRVVSPRLCRQGQHLVVVSVLVREVDLVGARERAFEQETGLHVVGASLLHLVGDRRLQLFALRLPAAPIVREEGVVV